MQIPLVDLKQQYQALRAEILAGIDESLLGMNLFLGESTRAFEREFAALTETAQAIGVSSGTDALYLALRALDVGPGDEVITVSNTFFATVEAIAQVGAVPVLVDIDPSTFNIDVNLVEAAITPRTKAIIPVHLYGQPAAMGSLIELAQRYGLRILEDACQAHGATYNGRPVGSLGDAAAFSFYFSKNLGAYGEAGVVVTNDEKVAARVRRLRDHGSTERYQHEEMGGNHRMDELQAVVLGIKLRHLDAWNEQRRRIAAVYDERLGAVPGVIVPVAAPGVRHVYHLYVVRVTDREGVRRGLAERGIATGIHYPLPIHCQPAWRQAGWPQPSLPVTEALADEILSLPIYPELTVEQAGEIADSLAACLVSGEAAPATVLS